MTLSRLQLDVRVPKRTPVCVLRAMNVSMLLCVSGAVVLLQPQREGHRQAGLHRGAQETEGNCAGWQAPLRADRNVCAMRHACWECASCACVAESVFQWAKALTGRCSCVVLYSIGDVERDLREFMPRVLQFSCHGGVSVQPDAEVRLLSLLSPSCLY